MGLMNSALQIGRTALLSYQSALQVVGNNVSSVGSPDYVRLNPLLDPLQGGPIGGGLQPGAGVSLTGIQRNIDEALEGRIRLAIAGQESATARQTSLQQVESFFDNTDGTGVATQLSNFFNTWDDLRNTPEDLAIRELVLGMGTSVSNSLRSLRTELFRLGEDLDSQVGDLVMTADDLAQRIADLNAEITTAEAGQNGQATGLRDQRDGLLRELSELFDVTVREQSNGTMNVYIGSEALIQGSYTRGLIAVQQSDGTFTRTTVRFADSNTQIDIRGGRLFGILQTRDQDAYGRVAAVDELAAALITEVNRIHADGQGLTGLRQITGAFDLLATDAPLDDPAAGLVPPPINGSFYITVADDATQTPVAYRLDVTLDGTAAGTTLESLATAINDQVQGVTASITSDRRLSLAAESGFSFAFGHDGQEARPDTSGVLAALGMNAYFTGHNAGDIAVNSELRADPMLVAAATTNHPGDGSNAGRIVALTTEPVISLGGVPIPEYFNSTATSVAVTAAAANDDVEASTSVTSALQSQKESISGVNLDEEAIALLKYQRAYQGASRYVSVVNDLLDELVALIR